MKIKKYFVRVGALLIILCTVASGTPKIHALDDNTAHIEALKKEAISLNYDRTNSAVFELIKLKKFDPLCAAFPNFGESNKQVAAKALRESGAGDLQVDRLLLTYYKSRNHWIDQNNYEEATGRDFQTFKCLQYLSEKYKVPMNDYTSEGSQRKKLPIVAEIIGRLEAVISPALQTPSLAPSDGKAGTDAKLNNNFKIESSEMVTPANGPTTDRSSTSCCKNWWPALIAVVIFLFGGLVWGKLKKHP